MLQGLPQMAPVDQLLTGMMVDYESKDTRYIGKRIFPYVRSLRTGTFYKGDAENEFRYEDPAWGNNVAAKEVDFRLGSGTFRVDPRAFRTSVSALDAADFIGPLALEKYVTKKLMKKFQLAKEVKCESALRTSTGIQSLAAGTAWNAAGLDPINDIDEANELILKAVGEEGNVLVIPPTLWRARIQTNAANTAGKQMRDQLGYVIAQTADNVTPTLFAKWVGVPTCLVPKGVKAAGVESTTPSTGGLTGTVPFIWGDTTQAYLVHVEENPGIGTSSYGVTFGPQDIQADVPYYDWQVNGNWYRVSAVQGEIETVPKAAVKVTGL